MENVLPLLLGYGLGSLPVGYLLAARHKGVDLRRVGSGNVGAANAYRAAGLVLALLVVTVDVAKGASSVFLAARLSAGSSAPVAAGVAAVVGHMFPVWLRFHGGKGVATACGVFWMLAPLATALAATLFIAMLAATRYVSLASLVATVALPPLAWVAGTPFPIVIGGVAVAGLIVQRHLSNLVRLQQGTERRLGGGL